MFESDADRLEMIKFQGGQLVRHESGQFWAIYDPSFSSPDGVVESKAIVLTARTNDVQDLPKDTLLIISDWLELRIKRHEPDGTGMTNLVLKR